MTSSSDMTGATQFLYRADVTEKVQAFFDEADAQLAAGVLRGDDGALTEVANDPNGTRAEDVQELRDAASRCRHLHHDRVRCAAHRAVHRQ